MKSVALSLPMYPGQTLVNKMHYLTASLHHVFYRLEFLCGCVCECGTPGDGQVDFEEFMTILGPKLLSSDNREGFLGNTIDNIFWQVRVKTTGCFSLCPFLALSNLLVSRLSFLSADLVSAGTLHRHKPTYSHILTPLRPLPPPPPPSSASSATLPKTDTLFLAL